MFDTHGGFGNLIALPLQYHPRQRGNTLFLNDNLEPLADQWGFLSTIPHLAPSEVERVAAEASARGQVIGVQVVDSDDDADDDAP